MNRATTVVLLALLAFSAFGAEDSGSRLHFKVHGFSIAPLEQASDAPVQQVLMMFLPASDGFAPNVNVQIQPFQGDIKEYEKISDAGIKAAGFTTLTKKASSSAATWEYSGEAQGRKFHFYAKAELGQGKVYLVTGAALESGWEAVGAKLKACVDGFKREEGGQGAPADKPVR